MATDSTNLPQGETTLDAGLDMAGSELDLTNVQVAQTEPAEWVDLPKGNVVVLLPVQPGQVIKLPTDSTDNLLAKIGPEGNLAIVVDGRTIVLQGYVKAYDQSPIKIVTNDGDAVNVADLIAATDPSLDIQTAAGPATGGQGDGADGSGIYIPFLAGPGLGGILAEGILDPTALSYRLIDDERKLFSRDEDASPDFDISFDILGGIINEDDLGPDSPDLPQDKLAAAKLVLGGSGTNGEGNDPFDNEDREQGSQLNPPDDLDNQDSNGNGVDDDREPLETVATIKVDFHGEVPGSLVVDLTKLPIGLTSEGELISYELVPADPGVHGNGIIAFIDNGGTPGEFDDGIDRLVFTVDVDKDTSDGEFKVTFKLYDNLDNEAPESLIGANEQVQGIPVHFTITDSTGTPVTGTLPLGVEDDIPFFGQVEDCGIALEIIHTTVDITHDETPGVQPHSDDVSIFNPFVELLGIKLAGEVDDAGFDFPFGDSEGSMLGAAKTKVHVSFGADGPAVFIDDSTPDTSIRNSVFGALQDKADGTVDDKVGGGAGGAENEHPFELFMVKDGTSAGSVTEGDLTIADQKTNATVTYDGDQVLAVYLQQIDAHTVVGYVQPGGPAGDKVAVFALNIDDNGCLSFYQIHQLNHTVDGPTFPDHDDPFTIADENGNPLIYVRATDYDGDHAIEPVSLVVEDDGPRFCKVDWGCDNDSKHGVGLIDEDKLDPNGNHDWAPGDDKGGTHADGTIVFDFGVDEPGHLEISKLTVKDSAGNVLLNMAVNWDSFDEVDGSIDVTGLNNLKTADGGAITVTATLDDGTGILTIVGKDVDGQPAFTFTLHTTEPNIGDFDFCLEQPLQHPFHDLDSKNDGPLTSFEDNLKFDFTVVGEDSDGDTATGHIKVQVDDDSPKATCDVDCVTEGETGGEPNYASGNVVTGAGGTIFGNDANNLDGNQDHPGADQPYTISKLAHDGVTYFLNTPEVGDPFVTKGAPFGEPGSEPLNDTTETFDPLTGVLHIPTQEGGTLDIVLVSDVQSEVGDYKYTVPADADHDVDHPVGPSVNESATFGDLTAWTTAWHNGGIDVVALGGSLLVKAPFPVVEDDPESPDNGYSGFGVSGGDSDEPEVDTDGNGSASEGLRLNILNSEFPGGVNNISLTIGALFDGGQYDSGHQEILQWEAWNGGFLVASGQILGDNDGLVTLDIDTLLPFDHVILKPIDNGVHDNFNNNSDFVLINAEICCPQDKFTEEFDYTLRDADGDESTATLKVDVKDTEPTREHGQELIQTIVIDEDGLPTGVGNTNSPADNSEDHSAPNAPVDDAKHIGTIPFTPGADPVSIELTVFGGPDTGMKTLDGEKIFAAWDATLQTLIGYIEGTDPNDAPNQVFKMHITDAQTGAYEFELLQPVKHNNSDIGFDDNTENALNFPANFIVVAEIEDKDCDVLFSKVLVTIDDDMPLITPCHDAVVDEDALPNGIEGGPGDDGVIAATYSGSLGVNFGADGGKSIEFLTSGQPNLKSHGDTVNYYWDAATQTLIGYTGPGSGKLDSANWVLTVEVTSLNNGGEYTLTLLKPLDHPDSNNNPADNNTDNGKGSFEDNLVFELKFKATDGDDDTVQGKLKVNVDDDSPDACLVKIEVDKDGDGALVHDETKGDDGDDDVDGPLTQFNGLGVTALGFATTTVTLDLSGGGGNPNAAYGADGPGTTELALTGAGGAPFSGTATNLFDTATGEPIFLYTEGDLVVGRVGSGDLPNVGGAISFALSLDDAGHLSVAQYLAIQHPDAGNPDDSVTLLAAGQAGNAVIYIEAKVTDYDGDAVKAYLPLDGEEGHGAIKFEDDGPTATCDYDHVTEGPGNFAAGNVVTGVDVLLLGQDANTSDGNADNPGVDGPYTISKLAHGGDTYELSADGLILTQNGGPLVDGAFVGGKLTITSEEGATFEIVMVSGNQADVGEYKYTPGPNPTHAEDVLVGPADLAATRSDAFNSVSEWTTSFSNGGITLIPTGGNLALKNIDVNPKAGFGGAEDYRGIGVDTGIDSSEVDTKSESLTLQFEAAKFPGGVNNAEVQIGALFNGVQFDSGSQEIVKWEAYDGVTLIASGQIVGDFDGLVTLDIDTPVNFNKIVLTPINNGAGNDSANNSDFLLLNVEVCKQEPVKEEFDYTLRDGDGDESSATLKICVEDTYPTVPQEGTLCLTVDEDGLPAGIDNSDSPNDAPATSASASGLIPFTAGADPVSIELTVGNGGDTGLKTLSGQTVLAAWDAATSTLIGYVAGSDPSNVPNRVFTMTVTDPATGAVTFDLLKPIKHADGQQDDNTENHPDPYITVNVQIEDQDCDVAFTTVKVKIDDDMPVVCVTADGDGTTQHDETKGQDNGASDDDRSGNPPFNVPGAGTAIGWARDGDSALDVDFEYGADGPGSVTYALNPSIAGVDSGLDTTDGHNILLFKEGNLVVGREDGPAGQVVFGISIDSDGALTVVQYQAIKHAPSGNDHDDTVQINGSALVASATVTDADGDSVTKSAEIGNLVRFDDDGPKADIDLEHDAKIVLDESVGTDSGDSNAADELNSVSDTKDIGFASVKASALFDDDSSYGTDGPGTKVFSLSINGSNNSGLDDTQSNKDVLLFDVGGGVIEGRIDGPAGDLVFTVAVDPATGNVTVHQYRAVEHNNSNDPDETGSSAAVMSDNKLLLGVTVTDGDTDHDDDHVDLGSIIKFEDDGPKTDLTVLQNARIVLDESVGTDAGDSNANDETATGTTADIGYAKVAAASLFTDTTDYGSDGAASSNSRVFSLSLNGGNGLNSGLDDVQTNSDVRLYLVGGVIEAHAGSSGGPLVFKIEANASTGEVTVTQYRAIEHNDPSDPDESGSSAAVMDDNLVRLNLTVTDGDGDKASDHIDLGKLIKFEDDGPVALNDIDAIETSDGGAHFFASGNVITGAGTTSGAAGADDGGTDIPSTITKLQGTGAPDTSFSSGKLEVNGVYGKLSMGADGNYTYDFDETNTGKVPSGATEVFTYTYTDKDGDSDTATLTIQFPTVTPPQTAIGVGPDLNGIMKEDVSNAIYFSVDPQEAGDRVTHVVITGLTGWSGIGGLDVAGVPNAANVTYNPATGTLEFDVTGAGPDQTITGSFNATPPEDSDKDYPLSITATVQDGPVVATGGSSATIVVDAVLDNYLDVTGANTNGGESVVGQTVNLGLTATLAGGAGGNPFTFSGAGGADSDFSEATSLIITVDATSNAAGVNLTLMPGAPAGAVLLEPVPGSGTWVLLATPALQQAAMSFVGAVLPAGFDGTVSGQITAKTQESNTLPGVVPASGAEPDQTDNLVIDTANFTLTVLAKPTPDVTLAGAGLDTVCVPEDTVSDPISVVANASASAHLTQVVITGFPTGAGAFAVDVAGLDTDGLGGNVVVDTTQLASLGQITITLAGSQAAFNGTFTVKAPADSDLDLGTLTATVTAANNTDPSITGTDSDQAFVRVDAVADGNDGDAQTLDVGITVTDSADAPNGTFQVGETGNVHVTASFDDFKDGSETHILTVQAAPGFSFGLPSSLPDGVTVSFNNGTIISFTVDSKDGDGVNGVGDLALDIPVTYTGGQPDGVSGIFSAGVTAIEGNSTANNGDGNDECTDANNVATDSAVALTSIAHAPDPSVSVGLVPEGHCIFEDTPATFVVNASTGGDFGSTLTSIVLTGLNPGWAYNFATLVAPGVSIDTTQLASGQVTITFSSTFAGYTGTFTATPPADSDADFGTLHAQVSAANISDPSVTGTDSASQYFETDAVADGKAGFGDDGDGVNLGVTITAADSNSDGDATFSTGEKGTLTLSAAFDDFHDGSEAHQIVIDAPAGFQFTGTITGLPAGVVQDPSSTATHLVFNVDSHDGDGQNGVGSFSGVQIEIQNVSAPSGTTASFTATATAVEQNTTASNNDNNKECTDDNNSQSVQATADAHTRENLVPIAYDDKKCGDEAAPKNVNLLLVFDNSGSMNSDSGLPGNVSKLEAAKTAAINLLNELAGTGGDVKVMLVTFNADSTRQNTWLTLSDAITAINAIPASNGNTNYEEAIKDAIDGFNDTDNRGDLATHSGLIYFLSDGQPTTGGNAGDNSITDGTLANWDAVLENPTNNIEHVFAVGLGNGIPNDANNSNLLDVANPVNDNTTETPNTVILVEDFNDLTGTLTGTVGSLISGNILDGSIENDLDAPLPLTPDFLGDTPTHVSFFEYDHPSLNNLDIKVTWDGAGALVVNGLADGENTVVNGTKVTFDTEFGRMTFDFSNGHFDFVAGQVDGGEKEEHFNYKLTDSNNDESNQAVLTICIDDKYVDLQPVTFDDVASGTEPGPKNVNLVLVFDNSGSMNSDSGISPGGISKLQAAKTAAINLLNTYAGTGGDVKVMLVTFNSDSTRQNTWLDLAAAVTAINAIPSTNNNTNYEEAIKDAIDGFNDTDNRGNFTTHDNLVYFLSDGEPTTGGNSGDNSITDTTLTNWDNLLENPANQIEHVYAVGLGTGIPGGANNPNLLDVANPVNNGSNETPNTVILVDDFNDLSATLTATVGDPIEGNILNGKNESDPDALGIDTPDFQGDGPAHLSYFEYDSADNDLDIKVTWDGSGAVVVDGSANGKALNINGKEVSFDTDHGRMTIDFTDGDFKFVPDSISGGNKTEVFDYKITDNDGDVSNESTLKVTIENLAIPDTNVGSGSGSEEAASIAVSLSGIDDNGSVTSFKITSLPANGTLYADAGLTNVITLNETVSALGNAATVFFVPNSNFHGSPTFQYAAIDNDGLQDPSPATATITVTPVNDAPEAFASLAVVNAQEQTNLPLHGAAGGLSIADIDAGNNDVTVTLLVNFGALTVSAGNTGVSVSGSPSSSVTLVGTVTEINNLLQDPAGFTGSINYTANSDNPPASATLTMTVNDGGNTGGGPLQDNVNVTINIAATNDAPTTNNVNASGNEDTTVVINLAGGDVDGSVAQFKITSLPSNGKLYADALLTNEITANETVAAIANAAQLFFVPTANYNGPASFQYTAIDNLGLADASPATASITVNSVADATVANPDSIITAINNDASFTVPHWALLANDSDGDGPLSINQIVSFDGTNFDNVTTGGGNVTVNTDDPFDAGDTALFTYKATDGTSSANATVTVSAVADANITGTDNAEIIVDNGNGHTINAGKGDDIVFGNDGSDTINGGDGDDFLDGGEGGDTYTGGKGNDTIDVGDGNDTVNYTSTLDGTDIILNFDGSPNGGGQDVLNLDALFDALSVAVGNRAGRVQITDNGDDTFDVRVNADTSNANFELHVATIHSGDTISVGSDVIVS